MTNTIACVCGFVAAPHEWETLGACWDNLICPQCDVEIEYDGTTATIHTCDDSCPEELSKVEAYVVAMKRNHLHELAEELGYVIEEVE